MEGKPIVLTKRWGIIFNIKIIFLLLIGLGGINAGWSLDREKAPTQYHLEIWKAERGLPQGVILTGLQTTDGYIWLGTHDGLICFDGIRFRVFNTQNTKEFKNNHIRALHEDREGRLWIGTGAGLACLYQGEFTSYSSYPLGNPLSQSQVRCITEDREGNLWIGTSANGLFCRGKKDGKILAFNTKNGLSDNLIRSILEDSRGRLWIGTENGLDLLENGKFLHLPIHETLAGKEVYAIFQDREKSLWFGSEKGLINLKDGKIQVYSTRNFSNRFVIVIFEDRDGNLWFGTDGGGGLYLYRRQDRIFIPFNTQHGLSDGSINSIFEDQEGSLWLGTTNGGLNRLKDTLFTTYSTAEGISQDMVWCVLEDSNERIWIGTANGLCCLVSKNGKRKCVTYTTKHGLCDNVINSIIEDRWQNIWIGTPRGLSCLNTGDFSISTIKTRSDDREVTCIHEDRQGNLWIGTNSGKLYYLTNNALKTVSTSEKLPINRITCMHQDLSGNLWIGSTEKGVVRLQGGLLTNESQGALCTHYSVRNGLTNNFVLCFYENQDGSLWIGTYGGGLNCFKDGKFVSCTTKDGLLCDEVYQVLEDNEEHLWMSSNKGILRVSKKELNDFANGKVNAVHPVLFNEAHGMKSRICNGGQPAGYKSRDGRLWFPTIKGLVMIDPASIKRKKNTRVPPVHIEEIIADNKEIKPAFKAVPREKLTFPPGTNKFEFNYTGLSFLEPHKVKFKFKLTGYENDWIEVGTRRTAYYANISPGHYTFNVMACNNDGMWNHTGTSFSFYLRPYFYQTTWFYFLAALFVFLAAFLGYRFRMRQLIAREKKLSQLVDLRTRALNEQTLELEKSKQVIEKKNQNILSSIQYARRIQQAILPGDDRLKLLIEDYFVLFKPRDIVSGDFYWFNQDRDLFFIAVVDCTGHGVPGALLSMIGNMKLNELTGEWGISEPAQILSHLHLGVRQVLHQEKEQSMTHDGMEVALCTIDLKQNKLFFAGAKRPLYYIKDSEFYEIKGDRRPIGGLQKEENRRFTSYEIGIDAELVIYLTTDGFADQNDRRNKKYGSKRMKQLLQDHAHLSMEKQKEALLEELNRHQGTEEQRDDITIIGIKLKNKK
ncbi:MAG: SpoIIE family protein phosphatase [Candidatus Aminicenantes bacterium]|nr:MAG: SpoIIE family protein phosphatase [Candidatus Aminicenantes bacterium]